MNDLARTTLARLVTRYGVAIARDPNRCEGLLRDTCPQCSREIFVLVHAARQHVTDDLLAPRHTLPLSLTEGFLVKRLEDELGLSREVAQWAVASWAEALGLATPSPAGQVKGAGQADGPALPPAGARIDRALYEQWSADLVQAQRPARLTIISSLQASPGPESTGLLIAALENDDPAVRAAAFDALADEHSGAGPAVINALHDAPEGICWRAAVVLGALKERKGVEALVPLLDGPDQVRNAAVWALGEIGDKNAITPLMKLLHSPDPGVVLAAEAALRKLGETPE